MRIKRPHEEDVGINVTPIIDMVFLLLIFFLVATKYADIERDVRVKPPGSAHARPVTAIPQEIVVNVSRDGALLIAGQERRLEDVDRLIGRAVAENPRQSVVIRGDRQAVLQHAVNVLDLCEKHGVERAYLTTRTATP
jgi:biopolymer transport protein ExbD